MSLTSEQRVNGAIIRMTSDTRHFYQVGAHGRLRVHPLPLLNAAKVLSHLDRWSVLFSSNKEARYTTSQSFMNVLARP